MPRDRVPANIHEIAFEPQLEHPPLTLPPHPERDPVYTRRVQADRLCLWLACSRALCRSGRHCNGTYATCVFENPGVVDPLLR